MDTGIRKTDGRKTARRLSELVEAGVLPAGRLPALEAVAARYAVAVTPYLLDRIESPDDPLGRQYLPDPAETVAAPEEHADPIGDGAHMPVKGIVHRYPDRVLLKPVHACAVYCRFCFRREMVGPGGDALSPAELEAALDYIRMHGEVWEVILTGGDPLVLAPRRLGALVAALDAIPHVGVIRLHTRLPVADPAAVAGGLVASLKAADSAVWVAVHINRAEELTPEARAALARLADAGIPLLGQTVLLRGVNDDPAVLEALFRAMVRARIKPYYLHHADLAPGTGHFRTTLAEGQALVRALRGRVSGLCQPTYVLDIPGGHGKAPAAPAWVREDGDGGWIAEDWRGREHVYPCRGDREGP